MRNRRADRGTVFAKPVHPFVIFRPTMKNVSLALALWVFGVAAGAAPPPQLVRQGTTQSLLVDGKPFLILGGELGN